MKTRLKVAFVSATTAGLVLGGAGVAAAADGTEDGLIPSCAQEATEATLQDPVGALVADFEAVVQDPGGFIGDEVDCGLQFLP